MMVLLLLLVLQCWFIFWLAQIYSFTGIHPLFALTVWSTCENNSKWLSTAIMLQHLHFFFFHFSQRINLMRYCNAITFIWFIFMQCLSVSNCDEAIHKIIKVATIYNTVKCLTLLFFSRSLVLYKSPKPHKDVNYTIFHKVFHRKRS